KCAKKRLKEKPRRKGLSGKELFKTLFITRLRGSGGPRLEIVALESSGKFRRRSKKFACFGFGEARKSGCFEIGRAAVRGFDERLQRFRQFCRQSEAQMNGGEQPLLHGLVTVADHCLER